MRHVRSADRRLLASGDAGHDHRATNGRRDGLVSREAARSPVRQPNDDCVHGYVSADDVYRVVCSYDLHRLVRARTVYRCVHARRSNVLLAGYRDGGLFDVHHGRARAGGHD